MASSGNHGLTQPRPLESRMWSMETLQEGLKTVQFQQMKEEDIDRDIKACMHAWLTQISCMYICITEHEEMQSTKPSLALLQK